MRVTTKLSHLAYMFEIKIYINKADSYCIELIHLSTGAYYYFTNPSLSKIIHAAYKIFKQLLRKPNHEFNPSNAGEPKAGYEEGNREAQNKRF